MELFQFYMQAMRAALDTNAIRAADKPTVPEIIEQTRLILDDYQAWAEGIVSGDAA